jgi:hypothetical protein
MTNFVNLKIKQAQSFGGAYKDRVCVRVFIGMSARMCMRICVCTVFLKKVHLKNKHDGFQCANGCI